MILWLCNSVACSVSGYGVRGVNALFLSVPTQAAQMNMEGFFLCYGDETPGSVEPTGEHASCFVGDSSECLAQESLKYLFVQPAPRLFDDTHTQLSLK